MFLHPKSVDAVSVYLQPFESLVWYAMLGLCVGCVFIVKLMSMLEQRFMENSDHQNDDSSFSSSLIIVSGFIFQQSKRRVDCWLTFYRYFVVSTHLLRKYFRVLCVHSHHV